MPFNLFSPQKPAQPLSPQQVVAQTQEKRAAGQQRVVAPRSTPTVNPTDPVSGMNAVIASYTTPEQEEKMRRSSVANQRIAAIGDALRHIGNIYHTVKYAPSQQFNSPVTEEYERYQKGKALRDAANLRYYTYQQQRVAQDQKARQWDAEQNYKNAMLSHYQDQDRRLWARDVDNAAYHEGVLGLRKEKQKLDEDYRNKRISLDEYNARSRRISAMASAARAGGSGGRGGGKGMDEYTTTTETTYNYDKYGKRTGTSTTKKRTVNGKAQPTQTTKKKALPGQTPTKKASGKKKLPGT